MEKLKISLTIITLNEERNIERCIASVPFADDVVVLDSGSTDRTVEIARRLGARVFQEAWRGFAKQKTRAMALGRHNWVLSLDADEALSPEAQKELYELASDPARLTAEAYSFPRVTFHLGRWLRHGSSYPDRQTRFFDKSQVKWTDTEVHEHIAAKNVQRLRSDILHWSFENVAAQVNTINRYSGLRAQDMRNQGKRFSVFKLLTKPFWKFIEIYFLKVGFRDGLPGFQVAVVSAFSTFLRHTKLKELEDSSKNAPK